MKRKIITTSDGSKTIQIEAWNEQYHSIHGAINEANHVFIKHGLLFYYHQFPNHNNINILEIGFGTGLNAFLTYIESEPLNVTVNYTGVEAYPVAKEEIAQLNYTALVPRKYSEVFSEIHKVAWEKKHEIHSHYKLTKQQKFFKDIKDANVYDIIYFDAFGARVQPELWTEIIFQKMYNALKMNGVLVTYSAKGSVRRALEAVGFTVERLPGPPGKREMLRAIKG